MFEQGGAWVLAGAIPPLRRRTGIGTVSSGCLLVFASMFGRNRRIELRVVLALGSRASHAKSPSFFGVKICTFLIFFARPVRGKAIFFFRIITTKIACLRFFVHYVRDDVIFLQFSGRGIRHFLHFKVEYAFFCNVRLH